MGIKRRTDLLRTARDVVLELNKCSPKYLTAIGILDPKPSARKDASKFKPCLMRINSSCAVCGKSKADNLKLHAAHIESLEEGGSTVEGNLVLLCEHNRAGGCHDMYDDGYASYNDISEAACRWRNKVWDNGKLYCEMLDRQKKSASMPPFVRPENRAKLDDVYSCMARRHWQIALNKVKSIKMMQQPGDLINLLTILKASIWRRRARVGALVKSLYLLNTLNPRNVGDYRALYFYEFGYLQQLLGNPSKAVSCYQKSAQCVSSLLDKYSRLEKVIGEAITVMTREIIEPTKPESSCALMRHIDELEQRAKQSIEELSGELSVTFAYRWLLNLRVWKVKMFLKLGQYSKAKEGFKELRKVYCEQDITKGWTPYARASMATLNGLLRLLCPSPSQDDLERGVRFLARATKLLVQNKRQAPEAVRDVLWGIERGIELNGICNFPVKLQKTIRDLSDPCGGSVRKKIVDCSSVLDPFLLDNS